MYASNYPLQVQTVSHDDVERLTLAISNALSERCNCPFSPDNIAEEQFLCINSPNSNSVLFRGSLTGSEDVDSVELLFFMQEWLLAEPTIALDGFSLHAAENCHVYSKEPANMTYGNCEWLPNTLRECRQITTGTFISIGLLALIALSVLAILVVVCIYQKIKMQRKPT